jgi:membrane protease YdiL (CAAX protease family)
MNENTPTPEPKCSPSFDIGESGQADHFEFHAESEKPAERRNSWAWVALALLFAFVIVAQNLAPFLPKDESAEKFTITSGQTGELRRALLLRDLPKWLSQNQFNGVFMATDFSTRQWHKLGENKLGYSVISGLYSLESNGEVDDKTIKQLDRWLVAIEEARKDPGQEVSEKQLDTLVLLVRAAKGERLTREEIEVLKENPDVPMFIYETVARLHGDGEPASRWRPLMMLGFAGYLLFIGLLGLAGWIGLLAFGAAKKLPRLELAPSTITKAQADGLALLFLLGNLILFGAVGLRASVLRFLPEPLGAAISAMVLITAICLLLSYGLVGFRGYLGQLRLTASGFLPGLGFGFVGYTMTLPVVFLAVLIALPLQRFLPAPSHPVSEQLASGVSGPMFVVLLIAAVVVAPFAEEVLFRGTLLPAMAKVKGSLVFAIVLSSVLFAAIHPTGIVAWPALAALGAMCALAFLFTKNIWSAIWLHAFWNGTLLIASFAIL